MTPDTAARVTRRHTKAESDAILQLENGARMDQKTFHALYLKTPDGFKAELIGGTVYVMSSPVSMHHGEPHAWLLVWLGSYAYDTPGVRVADNTTSILGEESEPQPDALLMVDPGYGGRVGLDDKGHVVGAPELVAEVAYSSASIDLNRKKADYERAGVTEYLVVQVRERRVRWFVRRDDSLAESAAGDDGVFRSAAFPGLWLDPAALFGPPPNRYLDALRLGLASPDHAAFVAALAARRPPQ